MPKTQAAAHAAWPLNGYAAGQDPSLPCGNADRAVAAPCEIRQPDIHSIRTGRHPNAKAPFGIRCRQGDNATALGMNGNRCAGQHRRRVVAHSAGNRRSACDACALRARRRRPRARNNIRTATIGMSVDPTTGALDGPRNSQARHQRAHLGRGNQVQLHCWRLEAPEQLAGP